MPEARRAAVGWAVFLAAAWLAVLGAGRAEAGRPVPPVEMKQVAPDLYFHFDFQSSNSIIWVTDEGVLVIDTRQHPRHADELIGKIRKITDKPIRWAFNTQAHGDHYLGNQSFKRAGATIVAQAEAARLMDRYYDKDISRRGAFFGRTKFDPKEIVKTLPDRTFDRQMVIRMGGKEAYLLYFGPAQDPGASFVYFPHAKALATSGNYVTKGWHNPMFTPSVDGWLSILRHVQQMEVDHYLPGHGGVGTKQDVAEAIGFLTDLKSAVQDAIAKGMSPEQAADAIKLDKYKDWRNANLAKNQIVAMHHLLRTGKSIYLDLE